MLHKAGPTIQQGAPEVSLLSSAEQLPAQLRGFDNWRSGVTFRDVASTTVGAREVCDSADLSDRDDPADTPAFAPVIVHLTHGCESLIADDETTYRAEARDMASRRTAWQVARELWTGAATGNPSLQSTGVDIGGSGDPTNVAAHLIANYEDATSGEQATVHLPSVVLPHLVTAGFVTRSGNRLLTPTGHVVVPGPGYPSEPGDWGPDASSEAASGEVWVYVTGVVEAETADVVIHDNGNGAAARQNVYEVFAQRWAIYRFDTSVVFAAKATVEVLE